MGFKNWLVIIIFCLLVGLGIVGTFYPYVFGNKQAIDLNQKFDYAVIELPNGEIVEGKVKTWSDYDGEQLQVTFENGDVYLTSSFNCTLVDYK